MITEHGEGRSVCGAGGGRTMGRPCRHVRAEPSTRGRGTQAPACHEGKLTRAWFPRPVELSPGTRRIQARPVELSPGEAPGHSCAENCARGALHGRYGRSKPTRGTRHLAGTSAGPTAAA